MLVPFMTRGLFHPLAVVAMVTTGCTSTSPEVDPTDDEVTSTETDTSDDSEEEETTSQTGGVADPIGGCVISDASGFVPDDLYSNTGVFQTDEYLPFTKAITVRGITLLGRPENEDAFMEKVATAIEEILPEGKPELDASLQEQMISAMYAHSTAIPFFKGDDDINLTDSEWDQFDEMVDNNSVCDVIFEYGGQGQTMEVVEHILHHMTMIGLHYVFYGDWGVNRKSSHYFHMEDARTNGWYNANYGPPNSDESLRIYLQEYAYWVISSEWDIQESYGGDFGGGEWTLTTPTLIETHQPGLHKMYQQTIQTLMQPPSPDTLSWFEE